MFPACYAVLPFPGAQVWIRIKCPFGITVIAVHAVMQMGWELTGGAGWSVSGASHITDDHARFNNASLFYSFIKAGKVGEIVINIVDITNSDPPAAEPVPSFHFHNPIGGRFHRNPVIRKDVGAFMNAQTAISPSVSPGIFEAVVERRGTTNEWRVSATVPYDL